MSGNEEQYLDLDEALATLLAQRFQLTRTPAVVLPEATIEAVAERLKDCKNVIVMSGAGISTSAGIPDFRSPDTGVYATMEPDDELPYPEAVFEIGFFKENPKPFFKLRKSFLSTDYKPTLTHCFLKLLQDKGVLKRVFTQNIDALEHKAGITDDMLVEAHGSIKDGTCVKCSKEYPASYSKPFMDRDEIPRCEGHANNLPDSEDTTVEDKPEKCDGVIKPGIVMFGEQLPRRFFVCAQADFPKCDLLIVMGTSLAVAPFNMFVNKVPKTCPRLLINRDKVGQNAFFGGPSFDFDVEGNTRDVFFGGDCDEGARKLAELAGWSEDLDKIRSKGATTI